MAWANIFDLADWDVYIQYNSITQSPSPDSKFSLVLASQLDPEVGTVTVQDGVIVCDLEDPAETGLGINVLVMPVGTPPETAFARLTATQDGTPIDALPDTRFRSVQAIIEDFPGEYSVDVYGALDDPIGTGTPITQIESSIEVPSGEGLLAHIYPGGV